MAPKVIPLSPPVGGGTFELHWPGKQSLLRLRHYPAALREAWGSPGGWLNRLYLGENSRALAHLLPEFRGRVNLVYIDPPFNSRATYKSRVEIRNLGEVAENEYSDAWNDADYPAFLYPRLLALRDLMAEDGLCCVHCDFRVNWLARALCEEVFGPGRLVNEIIWHYTGGGRSSAHLSRKHDTILVYAKSAQFVFNGDDIRVPYKKGSGYAKSGITSRAGKKYLPNPAGTIPDDVWDVPMVNPLAAERLSYPTQKPEALLERLIRAFSRPGDLALDCFMGSGTSLAAAMKLGRRFIGIDDNRGALSAATIRLAKIIRQTGRVNGVYGNFGVYELPGSTRFRNSTAARMAALKFLGLPPRARGRPFDGERDGCHIKIVPRAASMEDAIKAARAAKINAGKGRARVLLACFGMDSDLPAESFPLEGVEIIPLDVTEAEKFSPESEAVLGVENGRLLIRDFHPAKILQKLPPDRPIGDWRKLVECVAIDSDYDGEIFRPVILDFRGRNRLARSEFELPPNHGALRIKIFDILGESFSGEIA